MTGSCWREEQLSNMVRHDAEGKAENGLLETPSIISRADLLPAFSAHDVTSADEPSCTDPISCSSHAAARSARSEDPSYPAPVSSLYQTSVTILGGLDLAPASKSPLSGPSCSSPARNEPSHTSAQSAPLVDSETSVDLSSRLSVEGAALESTIVTVFAEGAHGSPLNSLSDPAFVIPDGNQSSIREQSGDLGHSAVEQERRSEENAVCDPPSIVRENSTEADQALAAAKTAPNGQISLQPERPIGASSGVPVNAAVTTKHLEVSSEEICAEKSAKRMAEGESMADKPVKRRRKYDFLFPEPETVEAALGHTAEIVIILAGMAQMRAGRAFTCVERNLAAAACQNIAALVSKLAPNALVSKEALEAMMQELDLKRMTQTRKEEQARAKALAEAEAVAKAKAVKAEAIAKLKLEEEARLKAEAEAQERRKATLNTASMVVDTPVEDALSAGGLPQPDTPPAQSTSAISPLLESTTSSTPVGQSTGHGAAQVGDVFQSEESPLLGTSQSQQSSKTPVGKPPKVRNRIRKDLAAPSLLSPDYLEYIHNQVPEPQRAQITHKQLCLAVQQFIQDQMPHAPQTHQALQHSYINTPAPCKLCKLVAKDTGTVVVCDSCDQLFHLKCVQPNNHTKGVPKGDWNCPSCSSGGRYYREKYGLYRRGSANGVKLWAPHEIFGDTNSLNDSRDSSIEAGTATGSKQMEANPDLTSSSKLRVEVGAGGHPSKDERGLGNYGGSPHLIVHLVNEPSPRTSGPDQNSSQNLVSGDRSGSQTKLTSRPGHVETKTVRDESEELGTDMQMEYGDEEDAEENFEQVLKAQVGRREKTAEKGNADFSNSLTGMQVEIPMLMEWVGDSIRTGEGKTYYRSCRVGGLTYHLSDCALFRPETPDVPPYIARLQALWEDLRTSHKWVRVSWCYYPSDIPVAMGRPGRAEPDEVYESNHCDNNLVGSIQGPCLVLSSKKFRKEHDRRKELQKRGGSWDSLPPVFLSRWLYDAPKGIFKAVSE